MDAFRRTSSADLDLLLEIENSWKTTPGWSRASFEKEIGSERGYFAVCERGGLIVGYAGLWVVPPEAQVTNIAVRPDRARQGVGRGLLAHLMGVAIAMGLRVMTLEVSRENPAAIALYRAAGFRVVGRRSKFYNDGSDALLMDKSLI